MKNKKRTCKKCKRLMEDNSRHIFCESCRDDMFSNVKKVKSAVIPLMLTAISVVIAKNLSDHIEE